MIDNPRQFLIDLFTCAVSAVDPLYLFDDSLPTKPKGRTVVVGAGKASAAMAKALEKAWGEPLEGLVITQFGYSVPCENIEVIEASHPIPDSAGLNASQRIFDLVSSLGADDLVIALISGGGSSLLCLPPDLINLQTKISINKQLLHSGASIHEMNCVRKHLSLIKGGRLAVACAPARVCTFLISDIPGDAPSLIASGPTILSESSRQDATTILQNYNIDVPAEVTQWLKMEASKCPDVKCLDSLQDIRVLATAQSALEAAAATARQYGVEPFILGNAIEGEAREVGKVHAAIARQIQFHNQPIAKPVVILSGGETTVTVKGKGRGGRNSEFLLSFALEISDVDGIYALSADTDGIDGSENNAGAFADGETIKRIRQGGSDALTLLDKNNAYDAFSMLNDLLVTGPTKTNVNDFRAIFIE